MDSYLNKEIHIPIEDFFKINKYDRNKQLSIMNNYDINEETGIINATIISTVDIDGRTDLLCLTNEKLIVILTEEEVNKYI